MTENKTCSYHPQQIAAAIIRETHRETYIPMGEASGAHHGYMLLSTSCGRRRVAPVLCSDPFCIPCERAKAAQRRKRWYQVLRKMAEPKFITLTIPSGPDLQERFDMLKESFRSLMGLRLGPRNQSKLQSASIEFLKGHYQKLVDSGDMSSSLMAVELNRWTNSMTRFWSWVAAYKSKTDKWPVIRNIIGKGFAVLEITYSKGLWHPHRHITADSKFIPWPLLCAAWLQVTDNNGFIVHIQPVEKTPKAQNELVKYLAKTWDVPEEKRKEFRAVVHGVKRIWPLGKAHPVDVREPCPYCNNPECKSKVNGTAVLIRSGSMWGTDYKLFETDDSSHRWLIMLLNPENGRWHDIPLLDTLRNCAAFPGAFTGPPVDFNATVGHQDAF